LNLKIIVNDSLASRIGENPYGLHLRQCPGMKPTLEACTPLTLDRPVTYVQEHDPKNTVTIFADARTAAPIRAAPK